MNKLVFDEVEESKGWVFQQLRIDIIGEKVKVRRGNLREILKKGNEGIVQIAEYYLKNGSIRRTADHFGTTTRKVKELINKVKELDSSMYAELSKKIYEARINKNEKNTSGDEWKKLGEKVTKRQLIDWYTMTSFDQDIAISELIALAIKKGIAVVG